ncbi:MAG: 6-phosphogluconolactonase [Candidatus Dormibacteria bacterium]
MSAPPPSLRRLHGEVSVYPSTDEVASAAATIVERAAQDACAARGRFTIALAGGNTPKALYHLLAQETHRSRIEWPLWYVYFGDERAVPPDDKESNYHMARETLLDHVAVDPEHIRRMPADQADLDLAADEYAITVHGDLAESPEHGPRFDCIILGLGENGHTASLFPGTHALEVADKWVVRGRADYAPYDRLTFTFPTINAAQLVMFLTDGESKNEALRNTAAGLTPAARVQPVNGTLHWLIDRAAAGDG